MLFEEVIHTMEGIPPCDVMVSSQITRLFSFVASAFTGEFVCSYEVSVVVCV